MYVGNPHPEEVVATGANGDKVFMLNDQIIHNDYLIEADENAGSFGPLTIDDGATVTIELGAVWTIV